MENPLVSVIVSAFNRPELLSVALASLTAQTYRELEIIVQDDSTDDACGTVVRTLGDPRIVYTRNVPPLGTSANLLAGYRKARGTYFSTLNDDDFYAPEYLERMVRQLESNAITAVAFSDHFIVDAAGMIVPEKTDQNTAAWGRDRLTEGTISSPLEMAIVRKSIPAMFAVFRRSAMDLTDFPDEVASGYDYWLTYLAVRDGHHVFYSPDRLTYYRSHGESQTAGFADPAKRLKYARYSQFITSRFYSDARLEPIRPLLRVPLARDYCVAGFALIRLGRRTEASVEFRKSLSVRPTLRAYAGVLACFAPVSLAFRFPAAR